MPDARVQAAIDHWAPRFTTNGVDPNDFRTTTARIERWDEWLDAWAQTAEVHLALARGGARPRAAARTAGEAFVARGGLLPLREVRLGGRRRAQPRRRRERAIARALRRAPPARPDGRADRGAARRRHGRRQPAPAARTPDAPPLVVLHPGPGLDQGGVLPLGGRLPRPRDGDAVARRPRPGRDRLRARTSAPTTRSRSAPILDALGRARRPRPRPRRRGGRQPRRLLRAARGARSSRGSGRSPASAARTTSAAQLGRPAEPHARDGPAPHRRRRRPRRRASAPRSSSLDGVAERIDQPACRSPAATTG